MENLLRHRIDEQLVKAMDRKVWLPSGGTLVIDRTEAMTVVDVNTGKFTGSGGNLEQTVTKNNLEAAEEIVRQLRLRDIGGIVVIDFIDMVLESNRDLVLRRLTEALGRDRTRHQVSEVTSLGLVQLTRNGLGTGLIEAFSTTSADRSGRGIVLHADPVDSAPATGRKSESGGGGRSRFSDERLMLFRAMKLSGLKPGDVKMLEMAPPMSQVRSGRKRSTDLSWVSHSLRRQRWEAMAGFSFKRRNTGLTICPAFSWFARTSLTSAPKPSRRSSTASPVRPLAGQGKPQREDAADFVGRFYYNQKPALLRWALTKPLDRVVYSQLAPRKGDFDLVRDLMIETGVLKKTIEFSEYADTRFSDKASSQTPWRYQPGLAAAK